MIANLPVPFPYQRLMILGCCGAGKSTFSLRLAEATGLPIIHLDQCYWQAGWEEPDKAAWAEQVNELAEQERWIIDGNYSGTIDLRLSRADAVVWLDTNRWLCLWRCVRRIIEHYNQVRPDMASGCPERFDWEFMQYVYRFHTEKRPALLALLEEVKTQKPVFIFRQQKEADRFIAEAGKAPVFPFSSST